MVLPKVTTLHQARYFVRFSQSRPVALNISRINNQKNFSKVPKASSNFRSTSIPRSIINSEVNCVKSYPHSIISKVPQNTTHSIRTISFLNKFTKKNSEDSDAVYKTFQWICKMFDVISFALNAQMIACGVGGLALLGGTAAVGYLVNPNFSVALVPEAFIGVAAAYGTYQLKEDVDRVGHALELIKSLLEPESEEGGGFAAHVIKESFDELRQAMVSGTRLMIIGPPVGSILTGITGFATGTYFLTVIGTTDPTVQTIAGVATGACALMAVGGVPALVICYAIYKRLKKKILSMVDTVENSLLSKLK